MTATSAWTTSRQHARRRTGPAIMIAITGVLAGMLVAGIATYEAWRAPDAFHRTLVGGRLMVPIEAGADAVIYFEGQPVPAVAALGLSLRSPSGASVAISPYEGTTSYDRRDTVATAIGRFRAEESGLYQLVSTTPPGSASIAVGQDLAGPVFLGLGLAAVVAAAGILLGIAIQAGPRMSAPDG